jgi:hypothetical protein
VTADSLVLGPVTLQSVAVSLRIVPTGAEITSLDASLFGGTVHLAGTLAKPASESDKPDYTLGGDFQKLNAADVGRLLGVRWTGGALSGTGNLDVSGYTDADLASSAKGSLHFECGQGSISNAKSSIAGGAVKPLAIPPALARFDRWSGDAAIANGAIELGQSVAIAGARKHPIEAAVTFGDPPQLSFPAPKPAREEKHK